MMKRFVFILALVLMMSPAFAQEDSYRERIAIHLNSTVLLTGEQLFLTVYCLDASSGKPTSLSTIAYVELVGENGKPFLQSKVKLNDGIGGGTFLLPAHMNSGNYTLIVYTRWMRNFAESEFFQKQLTVINPLRLEAAQLTPDNVQEQIVSGRETSASLLRASLDKKQYNTREQVMLDLANSDSLAARFSISIRALEDDTVFNEEPGWTVMKNPSTASQPIKFLPDLRGELVTGKVMAKSTRLPLARSLVSLSAPSVDFLFLISETDSSGRFYFNVPFIESGQLLITVPGKKTDDFSVELESPFLENYSSFLPSAFKLQAKHLKAVEKRFIHQQVEYAFSAVKRDSVTVSTTDEHFYGIPEKRYVLDRFTRFPTMEDVFREIIPEVVVKKRGETFSLEMFNYKYDFRFANTPLVLIDGIPVEDIARVMAYDPMLIKQISIRSRRYFYGAMVCDGIVSIETFTGEAKGLKLENVKTVEYIPPVPAGSVFSPSYDSTADLSRVPDYRNQLFWLSDAVVIGQGTQRFSFFTSDIAGKFLISIKGVRANGEVISQVKVLEVIKKK